MKERKDNHITIPCAFVRLLSICTAFNDWKQKLQNFLFIHQEEDGLSANQFRGVHMNDIPIVEDLLTLKILLYDVENVEGNIIGELA